jgi:hypothetical protein
VSVGRNPAILTELVVSGRAVDGPAIAPLVIVAIFLER